MVLAVLSDMTDRRAAPGPTDGPREAQGTTARAARLRGGGGASVMHLDFELGFELFELLPDAILAVDRQGVIRYANRQAGRLFGQEPATLVSTPVEALLPERLRERHIAHRAKYTSEPHMRPMG